MREDQDMITHLEIRTRVWLALILALVGLGATLCLAQGKNAGEQPLAKLQQTFLDAAKAYDQGHFNDAASLYESLVKDDYCSPELFYNLGNAYFRNGKSGLAVLNYRRAAFFAPRDPDIQANLRFALQSTSALVPDYPTPVRALLKMSRSEWTAVAMISYWGTAMFLCGCLLFRRRRDILLRLAIAAVLAMVASLSGIAAWGTIVEKQEAVVIERNIDALYGPSETSTASFALPEGSVVRVVENGTPWTLVAYGKQKGYVRSTTCTPVYSWQAGAKPYATP